MIISVASTAAKFPNLPYQFIAMSLGLNWMMMLYFSVKLGRWKAAMYPLMFLMNPFMNWIYMVHGIFTAGQRTWGGPRADAAAADAKTTPQQAVERATETGDDLNVVPESFKPALEARRKRVGHSTLQPTSSAEGRFTTDDGDIEKNTCDISEVFESDPEAVSIHTPQRVDELD